ncbi:MAG: aspartate aminotransferase family protein [Proteobacteria bacterium]|nr:aspartate aminotransferase family protein [Pseudomonadota bacterium]
MTQSAHPRSSALFERAQNVLPGGNTRTTVFTHPHPLYAKSGRGCRLTDVDGVERIDFINNYTALIHGNAHPVIAEAVRAQLELGSCFPMPTEAEIRLAELLCERVKSFERVRFTNSGSEAVMMAVKAARAYTDRPKIAKCEGAYHGSYDFVEVSQDPTPETWGNGPPPALAYSKGTPRAVLDSVAVIPFNQVRESEEIIRAHGRELACVVVDPMPLRGGLIPARREYLEMLRAVTAELGIVLVFDEVISFRLGYHGAQGVFGVDPDLTTLGKIIGGGFAVGAVAGRADVMAVFDPRKGKPLAPHGGTFNANPITMAAGLAAMSLLTPAAFERLGALGERTRATLARAFARARVPGQVAGMGSLFRIHLTAGPLVNYRSTVATPAQKQALSFIVKHLLDHGVLITQTGMGNLSTPMTEAEIDDLGRVFEGAIEALSRRQQAAE